ncbi:hypothetical protein AX17_004969 [Amanita inopinata Kibby_2008]|nr:hypothetical protein AX17_004969 [Amanita inopinata Kibby_2008]
MSRPARLHRLPRHLDYTLIPAPLDLSLTLVSEKSPLPAIIVTPSSPSSTRDFSIAFLAPPPKPTLRERIISCFQNVSQLRSRTTLILMFAFFVLLCHYLAHRLAISRSHLDLLGTEGISGVKQHGAQTLFGNWFDLSVLWGGSARSESAGDFALILDSGS